MAIKLKFRAIAKRVISVFFTTVVAVFFATSAIFFAANSANAAELVNQSTDSIRQPAASPSSQAINISIKEEANSPGRYQISGTVVDANGRAACGLALASGKCVFTCGSGKSPRCEGGDSSLPQGQFELTNLVTEPTGAYQGKILLQTFVSGSLPGFQPITKP